MKSTRTRIVAWIRLAVAVQIIAIIWLIVLPAIQRLEPIDRHLRLLEEKRIDASALYYTDLEVMRDIYDHRQQRRPRP